MRRQERPEALESLLLHASLRHRAAATSAAAAGHAPASARHPKRRCLWSMVIVIVSANIIADEAPEASVAEGGGQGEVVRGVGQELSDEVQVSGRAREAEGHGAGHEGGQDAHGVVEVVLESLWGRKRMVNASVSRSIGREDSSGSSTYVGKYSEVQ